MSALGEQHQAWVAARKRLFEGSKPLPKPERRVKVVRSLFAQRPADPPRPGRNRLFRVPIIELDDNGQPLVPHIFRAQWRSIAQEVALKHDVTVMDLQSPRRDRPSVLARHEAFWRCRTETMLSLPEIGRRFGGRDHTTVLHGISAHERRMLEAAEQTENSIPDTVRKAPNLIAGMTPGEFIEDRPNKETVHV